MAEMMAYAAFKIRKILKRKKKDRSFHLGCVFSLWLGPLALGKRATALPAAPQRGPQGKGLETPANHWRRAEASRKQVGEHGNRPRAAQGLEMVALARSFTATPGDTEAEPLSWSLPGFLTLKTFEMQDEKLQDNIQQPVHRLIEWNQLKMVLKNLSFLRLFNSSNPRIQELHSLAKRCWNSPLKVRKVLLISRNNAVCYKVDQNTEELREAKCSKEKLESKMFKSTKKPKESEPKVGLRERKKVRESRAAVPEREEQVGPEGPKAPRAHRLATCAGAGERQLPPGDPRAVFLKSQHGDAEQLEAADQWIWFEGLPTRIHLPGPRVMCRSSALRWVKRCCTRCCSASLELPMCHPYRV